MLIFKRISLKARPLKGIQHHIVSKTNIENRLVLARIFKKAEEEEKKRKYLKLSKDNFSCIERYKEVLD